MKWINGETWETKVKRLSEWHPYFAWVPIVVGVTPEGRKIKIWLESVQRRGKYHFPSVYAFWSWEYKEKEEK